MTVDRVARWATLSLAAITALAGLRLLPDEATIPIAFVGAMWTALAGHAFVVCYWIREKWWRSSIGRHLMCFMGGLTAIVDLTIANFLFGPFAQKEFTLFVWLLMPALFTWRLFVLLRVKSFDGNGNLMHK